MAEALIDDEAHDAEAALPTCPPGAHEALMATDDVPAYEELNEELAHDDETDGPCPPGAHDADVAKLA